MPIERIEERKLAAIMFTDVVGYSALAQRDDKVAIGYWRNIVGCYVKFFRDFTARKSKPLATLSLSNSEARWKRRIEIQRTLAKRNHDVTSDWRIEIKIGIHIGDVVHRDGDVYGDGVNIASRIEALAGAGGICISTDVERQIRNALEARFEKFGSADLKNIKLPMELFRIVLPWEKDAGFQARPTAKKLPLLFPAVVLMILALLVGWWWMQRSSKNRESVAAHALLPAQTNTPDEKSVAVLSFVNLSDDKGSEYFSDGVSEELLTVLQKFPACMSPHAPQHFPSKARVWRPRISGKNLALLIWLTEACASPAKRCGSRRGLRADTGDDVWSENFTRALKDVFAVQTELAETIVAQVRDRLTGSAADSADKQKIQAQGHSAQKGGTKNVEAHQAYLQGRF